MKVGYSTIWIPAARRSLEESLRSLMLFNDHVMPALEEICP